MGKKFAEILKQLRTSRNLSQEQLADDLGVKRSAIGNYEQGTRSPNMEQLEAIADFFNVDMNYLYGKTNVQNRYHYNKNVPDTIAAHFEGNEFSSEALDDISGFIEFVKTKERQ